MGDDDQIPLIEGDGLRDAVDPHETGAAMGKVKPGHVFIARHGHAPGLGEGRAEVERSAHGEFVEDVTEEIKHVSTIAVPALLYRQLNDLHET